MGSDVGQLCHFLPLSVSWGKLYIGCFFISSSTGANIVPDRTALASLDSRFNLQPQPGWSNRPPAKQFVVLHSFPPGYFSFQVKHICRWRILCIAKGVIRAIKYDAIQ